MPVINLLLFYKIQGTTLSFFIAMAITICISITSWLLVEKPFLKLKKNTFRKYI